MYLFKNIKNIYIVTKKYYSNNISKKPYTFIDINKYSIVGIQMNLSFVYN